MTSPATPLANAVQDPDLARTLVVVPCLNEESHIDALLAQLRRIAPGALVVVADGGSTDATPDIVRRHVAAAEPSEARVVLLHNARRIQSSAVNLAVAQHGAACDTIVRVDAHCHYPDNYIAALLAEARETGADSVVVAMETRGQGIVQAANAAAQNSRLGNGGSAHRSHGGEDADVPSGEWVDHGHHALMRLDAFAGIDGYDESFTHNEDAELDLRLAAAGCRVYLTRRTHAVYTPRSSWSGLWRQYFAYGRGRARTVLKHAVVPRIRQLVPLAVAPALVMLAAVPFVAPLMPGPLAALLALPTLVWALACAGAGVAAAVSHRRFALVLTGLSIAIMHAAWSFGFWRQLVGFAWTRVTGTARTAEGRAA